MTQNKLVKPLLLAVGLPLLYLADVSPEAPLGLTLVRDAHAIVGAPLTPVSVAGVARRTTRRAVVATSTATAAATSATAQQQAATAQQQSATAQQQSATAQQQAAAAQKPPAPDGSPGAAGPRRSVRSSRPCPPAARRRPRVASSTSAAATSTTGRPSRATAWFTWCSSLDGRRASGWTPLRQLNACQGIESGAQASAPGTGAQTSMGMLAPHLMQPVVRSDLPFPELPGRQKWQRAFC